MIIIKTPFRISLTPFLRDSSLIHQLIYLSIHLSIDRQLRLLLRVWPPITIDDSFGDSSLLVYRSTYLEIPNLYFAFFFVSHIN